MTPRPTRKRWYTMPAALRIAALERDRNVLVPKMGTGFSVTNFVGTRIELGRFASPEQAILFAVTGVIRWDDITLTEILKAPSRAGYFRWLNEAQIEHLLSARRLTFEDNRKQRTISLYQVEASDGFEVEIEGAA